MCGAIAGAIAGGTLACARPPSDQPVDVNVPSADGGSGDAEAAVPAPAGSQPLIDRAGHALTSTILLVPGTQQDDFNAQPTFGGPLPRLFRDAVESRLVALDRLALGDGGPDPVDWPVDAGPHPLLPVFAGDTNVGGDFLIVDPSLPCVSADGGFAFGYFDIEREIYLMAPQHTTCGGRTPSDPVVDRTLRLLVTGDRDGGPTVFQGVPGPTRPPSTHFPYLADPN
jgi:hypothetical protein